MLRLNLLEIKPWPASKDIIQQDGQTRTTLDVQRCWGNTLNPLGQVVSFKLTYHSFFFYDYPTPYQKLIPCTSSEITPSQPLCCFAVSAVTLINTIIMSTVLFELTFIIAKSFHTIGYIILHNQKLWKKCFHSGLKGKHQPINTSSVMPKENGYTGNY